MILRDWLNMDSKVALLAEGVDRNSPILTDRKR